MPRIIIGIHGLRNKPPKNLLKRWWKAAIREGLFSITKPRLLFPFEMVFWADVLHPESLDPRQKNPGHPLYIKEPYCRAGHGNRKKPSGFRKKILDLLEKQMDNIFLNEDRSINFASLTDKIIRNHFEDLHIYYSNSVEDKKGNAIPARDLIRDRLIQVLEKHRGKKILLIAHSMGSIIAYDVLSLGLTDVAVDTLVTMGSPLALPVIIQKNAAERGEKLQNEKLPTPEQIQRKWWNLSDLQDKVALNYTLGDDYGPNSGDVSPKDIAVYNNYAQNNERNPHKSYGYLRTPEMAWIIHNFLKIRFTLRWKSVASFIAGLVKIKHNMSLHWKSNGRGV